MNERMKGMEKDELSCMKQFPDVFDTQVCAGICVCSVGDGCGGTHPFYISYINIKIYIEQYRKYIICLWSSEWLSPFRIILRQQ